MVEVTNPAEPDLLMDLSELYEKHKKSTLSLAAAQFLPLDE